MLKYYLLLLSYCILRVQGIYLEFSGCNTNGWMCQYATSGIGIDIIYTCTKEIEQQSSNITWRYNGLPSNTESVTIENCNITLTLNTNLYSIIVTKMDKAERVNKILNDNLINFRSITIRNVKELKLQTNFKDLLSRLRGHASVLLEDVELINVLPSHIIEGPYPFIQKNKMESFNFTMRRVKIQQAEDRAILWDKEYIPFFMEWENVNIETAKSPVEIVATTSIWPHSEIQEPENNQVYIRNCTFKTMGEHTFILNTTFFHFTNNYVDTIESWGFDINSLYTNISGNKFNNINDYAFGHTGIGKDKNSLQFDFNTIKNNSQGRSLYFKEVHPDLDLQSRVSIHGNRFSCFHADWLTEGDGAEYLKSSAFQSSNWYLRSIAENKSRTDNFCIMYVYAIPTHYEVYEPIESYVRHFLNPVEIDSYDIDYD